MFNKRFSVCSSSLNLLKTGEQGIVTRFRSSDETITQKLTAMGMKLGMKITIEQRFPSYVIKSGNIRLALDELIARSIFVRITDN
ncbi:MAG TPA: FeoA family protein [Stenomitos sp.]